MTLTPVNQTDFSFCLRSFLFLSRESKEMNFESRDHLNRCLKENPASHFITGLGLSGLDPSLIFEALTHKSLLNEVLDWPFPPNERLEFLGDAVLELWCSARLFNSFEELNEGQLSRFRGAVVNEEILGEWGRLLGLDDFLLVGKGEWEQELHRSDSLVSDVFEALVGASFVCLGWDGACLILNRWEELFNLKGAQKIFDLNRLEIFDPKSQLQEKTMANFQVLPEYSSEVVDGGFEVFLKVRGQILASLTSPSKKKAERALARKVLKQNLLERLK